MQTTEAWPIALASFSGQLDNHYPPHKLIALANRHEFIFPKVTKSEPISNGLVVFTDGSSTGIAAYVSQGHTVQFQTQSSSAQLTELQAVIAVFSAFPNQPLNIYTDSAYIAQSIPNLETAPIIKHTSSAAKLFKQLQQFIISRTHPFFIGHLRAHSGLPGPLSQGNQQADLATRVFHAYATGIKNPLSQAQHTHNLHHLNAHSLRLLHHITREQARQIVKECTQCATHLPVPHLGVNPRGLVPNALWQMDITHVSESGNLKYVHVCIDTCSGYVFATLQTGEATKHVIGHLLSAFATLGCPQKIKTDNGPGYTSTAFAQFCSQLNIQHITGSPYNPQGQEIVEKTHLTLKLTLQKIKKGEWYPIKGSPRNLIAHSLFILNFLTLDKNGHSAAERHWQLETQMKFASMMWKDPMTGSWHGPDPVLIWGRGSVCVYAKEADSARWLPERLVKQIDSKGTSGCEDNNPSQGIS
uniref:RNA-directed DNA polymerase n=1 Tax=Callithrix jacchus TaxID=9483 RepID=A0A8I3WZI5_CALJA